MSSEAKVGATALIGIILTTLIVLYLSGVTFAEKGYPVKAVFKQINGLIPGNAVNYAGVKIGKVKAIKIVPEGVEVELSIDKKVQIPKGASFTINSAGLMGEQYVSIKPPASPGDTGSIQPNEYVNGIDPQNLDELFSEATSALKQMRGLIKSLEDVFGDEKVKGALRDSALNSKELTENLKNLTATLDGLAQNNESRINELVVNLSLMAESLRSVSQGIDNNGKTAADLVETVENIKIISQRVEKIAASLEDVTTDPETVDSLKATIKNAKDVSEKANKTLTQINAIKTSTELEFLYDATARDYVGNIYLKVMKDNSPSFAIIGVSDIGEDNNFNLQYGRGYPNWAQRIGVIESKFGVGLDYKVIDKLQLSFDLYDPNDVKYKARAKFELDDDLFLIGQTTRDKERARRTHNYFGLQKVL
ncbi:MlaD family protein [Selenomonadales bacterium OttesenSCG-928-I06]|nr:MlaD family protein [Selenomonadales bacterium OttesenSCG-928-I06]